MARVRCVGVITNNFGEPIPQGLVCVERTNEDFTDRESVVKYRASNRGVYDFYIKAGYYSIYYLENKDGTREFMGNVHVIPKYKFTTCTVEELIEKFAVEVENEDK